MTHHVDDEADAIATHADVCGLESSGQSFGCVVRCGCNEGTRHGAWFSEQIAGCP